MEQDSTNPNQTPARRNRGGKPRGRKNYASEGDALTEMPTPASFPATPIKSNRNSPAPGTQPAQVGKSTTKKNTKKPRPSNVSTTPSDIKPSQRTPPPSGSVALTSAAFASSSSFHSPAPDTLPRPNFSAKFTKSQSFTSEERVLTRTHSESVVLQTAKEPSPPASDPEYPSPSPRQPATLVPNQSHESPLEFLFQAERAKEERLRRAKSANTAAAFDGPFSAPTGSRFSQNQGLNDNPIPLKLPIRSVQRGVSDNTGMATSGTRPGVFALPIHDRVQATGPHAQRHSLPQRGPDYTAPHRQYLGTPPQMDKSEQMKRLLGIATSPSPSFAASSAHGPSGAAAPSFSASAPSSMNTRLPGKPTETASFDRKNLLENTLRQALNLPCSMPTGLDGNNSPQSRPGRPPGQF